MANGDIYKKASGVWSVVGSIAGPSGPTGTPGATGATGPAGVGGAPSTCDFRLSLSSGNSVYAPQSATPSSTNTGTGVVTFAVDPGWTDGTIVTPASTLAGLTAGTKYFMHRISATTFSFHTSVANALAGSPVVTLSTNVTQQINPSGVSNTSIYFTPHIGNTTFTYVSSAWTQISSAEISLALGTLTSGKNYDVFAYSNTGTLTLELSAAWTSDTVRADAIARQDGIWVKSSDHTRRYVGTIRMDSTTTTIDDAGGIISQSGGKRFVWNAYNRVSVELAVIDTTASWTYNSSTPRQANGASGNKVEFVIGLQAEQIEMLCNETISPTATTGALTAPGIDVTNAFAQGSIRGQSSSATLAAEVTGRWNGRLSIGYHSMNWLEAAVNANAVTINGTNGGFQSGMRGTSQC